MQTTPGRLVMGPVNRLISAAAFAKPRALHPCPRFAPDLTRWGQTEVLQRTPRNFINSLLTGSIVVSIKSLPRTAQNNLKHARQRHDFLALSSAVRPPLHAVGADTLGKATSLNNVPRIPTSAERIGPSPASSPGSRHLHGP